jgi:hypothetical protein
MFSIIWRLQRRRRVNQKLSGHFVYEDLLGGKDDNWVVDKLKRICVDWAPVLLAIEVDQIHIEPICDRRRHHSISIFHLNIGSPLSEFQNNLILITPALQ